MRRYLNIKNALIAGMTAALYYGGMVDGLPKVKVAAGLIAVFVFTMRLLRTADESFIRERRRTRR